MEYIPQLSPYKWPCSINSSRIIIEETDARYSPVVLEFFTEQKLAELRERQTPSLRIIATKGTLDWAYPPFILSSTAAAHFIPAVKEYCGAATLLPRARDADVNLFVVPELGYNKLVNPNLSASSCCARVGPGDQSLLLARRH